jgi:hypothetical protein
MPTSDAPSNMNEPKGPTGNSSDRPEPREEVREPEPKSLAGVTSRWVNYDTYELLQMINDLEDERRWSRFREGVWIAILFHVLVLLALIWLPKYVLNAPRVIDPLDALDQRKELSYLDLPSDALRKLQAKEAAEKPPANKPTIIDKKTLEDIKEATPPPAKAPEQAPAPQAPVQPQQQTPTVQQPQLESPRPAAVPVRPNFAMGSQNPASQLRDAMRGASRNPGQGGGISGGNLGGGGLARHPGAGSGGVQVLSDTQGVDFRSWLQRWHHETERTWDPLIPDEVNPPILKTGMVAIRFKVLPNGRLMDGSLMLEGRSGDTALDRAAWGALTGSNYPPLPRDFHGPYLELRAYFLYNMQQR